MTDAPLGLCVRLLYPFAAVLEREGVEEDELLRAAGMPRPLFEDPKARVALDMVGRFLRAALERTQHRALGIEAAKRQDEAQFQLFEYFVASSPRIETAVEDLVRYQAAVGDSHVLSLQPHDGQVLLRYQPPVRPPRVMVEYVLGMLLRSATRSLGGWRAARRVRQSRGLSVWFAYSMPESARQEYTRFFGRHVVFDAEHNGLLVSQEILRRKSVRANPIAHEVLEAQIQTELRAPTPRGITERVRTLISDALPNGDFDQDTIARALRVSRTTLKRRLAAEGTHVRALVDEVRKETALRALRQSTLSVTEIAHNTGYADATAFDKAFKRWTGSSPAQHRAKLRARKQV